MDTPPYVVGPALIAPVACELITVAGHPFQPPRLRSWHNVEGLQLGTAMGTGWRRYNDIDILTLAFLCALANHGIPAGELVRALSIEVRGSVEWVVRTSSGDLHSDGFELYLAAYRDADRRVRLHCAGLAEAYEGDPSFPAVTGSPVTVLNLSTLASRVRAASLASTRWRDALARQKGNDDV